MSRQRVLSSLVVSTSVLAMAFPAQANAPEFVDDTGFFKSRAQTYATPHQTHRGGWGLDYRGMSAHDPSHSRVHRLSDQERAAFVAKRGDAATQAKAYINHHARSLGIEDFESGAMEVVSTHQLWNGASIVKLRQRVQDVEVFGPELALLIDGQGRLATVSGSVHTQLRVIKGAKQAFRRSADQVLSDVLRAEVGDAVRTRGWSRSRRSDGSTVYRSNSKSLGENLRTKPLYIPTAEGLEPAYFVEFSQADEHGENGVMMVARASDSRVLYRKGLTHADSFKYRVWARDDKRNTPLDNPIVDFTPHPKGTPNSEKPGTPAQTRLVEAQGFNTNPEGKPDPWLPTGATESKGNNVDAYTDRDEKTEKGEDGKDKVLNDGFTEGDIRAKVTAAGEFDRQYDLDNEPGASDDQKMAAVTQIFYTVNWLHDYWYDLGWDEKSGNAQMDNYGRAPNAKDGDPILAQAQDSADSGQRNNANMTVYADGVSPRMQMYLWTNKDKVRTLKTNPKIDGFKDETGSANYGKQDFDITAPVVLVKDPKKPFEDGCEEVADPKTVRGKIVLVKMGYEPGEDPTCKSIQRAALLQKAGAVGMIFMDSTERVPGLGGSWPTEVTLPALSINKSNGDLLLAQMEKGPVTLTMTRDKAAELDGSIDNQVVAHEWGHYAHLRLVKCGGNGCFGMSEGWADYFAFHMSLREGDDFNAVYPLAVYANSGGSGDPFYFGLRRYPYSNNKKINPLMFHHIANGETLPSPDEIPQQVSSQPMSEVHNAGEIWAEVLIAVESELHEANKTKDKPLSWDEVHRLVGKYFIAGMKLTPAQPTWTEQRDAILAVALASDKKDFDAMVRGFASRGMGTCAVSPPADSPDNVGAASSEEISGFIAFRGWALDDSQSSCDQDGILDVNERGNLTVTLRNVGMDLLKATKVEVKSLDEALVVDTTGPLPVKELAIDKEEAIAVPVRLVKAPAAGSALPLEIILTDDKSCQKSFKINVKPRVDLDEVATSTALETFESDSKLWTTAKIVDGGQEVWERITENPDDESNFVWRGRDLAAQSDAALVSPAFKAKDDEDFIVEFEHAYAFEASEEGGKMVNWDGGLIEYSDDDGKTWKDLKDVVVNPEFNGVISDIEKSKNPLTGRNGYVGTSPGYPARSLVRLDFRRNVVGKAVKIRFRIGTDAASGAPGWVIDNLKVSGAAETPFTKVVPDACDAGGGESGTGGGETGGDSGSTGGGESNDGTDTGGNAGANPVKPKPMGCGCSTENEQTGFLAGLGFFMLGLFRRRKSQGVQR